MILYGLFGNSSNSVCDLFGQITSFERVIIIIALLVILVIWFYAASRPESEIPMAWGTISVSFFEIGLATFIFEVEEAILAILIPVEALIIAFLISGILSEIVKKIFKGEE